MKKCKIDIHKAIAKSQSLSSIGALIDKYPFLVHEKDKYGYTILHNACKDGRIDIVEFLIHRNIDVNQKDERGGSPLHFACRLGHKRIVEILVEEGNVNVNSIDIRRVTPLHEAAQFGYYDICAILIENGAFLNAKNATYGDTPLHLACELRHTSVAQLLLDFGADANSVNDNGQTPLHWACNHPDNYLVISALLEHNGNINARNKLGSSPLHWATRENRFDALDFILAHGADINIKNYSGECALFQSVKANNLDAVNALLRYSCCNIEEFNHVRETALHLSCRLRNLEITRALIAAGANLFAFNMDQRTPLDYCTDEMFRNQVLTLYHWRCRKSLLLVLEGVPYNFKKSDDTQSDHDTDRRFFQLFNNEFNTRDILSYL